MFDMKKFYRFFRTVDDATFRQRVSDVFIKGYILHGNPIMVMDNSNRIAGQMMSLPAYIVVCGSMTVIS